MNGKGGTGKSTVAALAVDYIASNGPGSVLAVDADPNSTLSDMLGMKVVETMVDVVDETAKKMNQLPAGMTKDRFIEMKIQESISEGEAFDLLAMGRPEGPGCYCYINSVLRDILNDVTKSYDYVIIDNAAGMEHISRKTERIIDRMMLVSDYSLMGVRSSRRIYELARQMQIRIGKAYLVINKAAGAIEALKPETDLLRLPLAGTIDYDEELLCLSVANKPITELKSDRVKRAIKAIMGAVLGE